MLLDLASCPSSDTNLPTPSPACTPLTTCPPATRAASTRTAAATVASSTAATCEAGRECVDGHVRDVHAAHDVPDRRHVRRLCRTAAAGDPRAAPAVHRRRASPARASTGCTPAALPPEHHLRTTGERLRRASLRVCGTCTPPATCGGGGSPGCAARRRERVHPPDVPGGGHVRPDRRRMRRDDQLRHLHAAGDVRRRRDTRRVRRSELHAGDVRVPRRELRTGRRRLRRAHGRLRDLHRQRDVRRRRHCERVRRPCVHAEHVREARRELRRGRRRLRQCARAAGRAPPRTRAEVAAPRTCAERGASINRSLQEEVLLQACPLLVRQRLSIEHAEEALRVARDGAIAATG